FCPVDRLSRSRLVSEGQPGIRFRSGTLGASLPPAWCQLAPTEPKAELRGIGSVLDAGVTQRRARPRFERNGGEYDENDFCAGSVAGLSERDGRRDRD